MAHKRPIMLCPDCRLELESKGYRLVCPGCSYEDTIFRNFNFLGTYVDKADREAGKI